MVIKELTDLKWYKLSLDAGAVIHKSLQSFLIEKNLDAAYVLSCVGSCTRVNLVYPKTVTIPPELGTLEFNGLFEINGIVGDVKREHGDIKVHLHGSFTKEGKDVFGGGGTGGHYGVQNGGDDYCGKIVCALEG